MVLVLSYAPILEPAQIAVYTIGLIVGFAQFVCFCMIEDANPYLLRSPFISFSQGMNVEEYWEALVEASSSASFATDLKTKLGINSYDQSACSQTHSRIYQDILNTKVSC